MSVLFALCGAACVEPPARPAAEPVPAPQVSASHAIAIRDVNVVPLDSERVLAGHTVVVDGGRIVALGPSDAVAVPPGARIIDGHGQYLLPGLADMHVHLTRTADLALYLARGVTSVRNMWGAPIHLAWRKLIAAGTLAGPTIYTGGPIIDGPDPVHDGSVVVTNADEAERSVALHDRAHGGYDFVKVYTGLSPEAFGAIAAAAGRAGLSMAGHVPRAVGMERAVAGGLHVIEHLSAFSEALQADGSPVAGKFDDASLDRKIEFVDEAKLPALAAMLKSHDAWVCPTRNLGNQLAPEADVRARLARPEMRYMPGFELAIWQPKKDGSADQLALNARRRVYLDHVVHGLAEGGVHLLAGTDTGNPLAVPGYTLHEELALFVQAGLTPYQALRAATADAALFLHEEAEFGTVALGRRADLLLVEGNPLADVTATTHIRGVMVRGAWLDVSALESLLAGVQAYAERRVDPFVDVPPLAARGTEEGAASYTTMWKGVAFDAERVRVSRLADGTRLVSAQNIDPHSGVWMTLELYAAAPAPGEAVAWRATRMVLAGDGAGGRGRIELLRTGAELRAEGTLLSGVPAPATSASLPEGGFLTARHFIADKFLLAPALATLEVGKTLDIDVLEAALGSALRLSVAKRTVTRTPDAPFEDGAGSVAARRYELSAGKRKPEVLWLDERGEPLGYEVPAFGVRVVRSSHTSKP